MINEVTQSITPEMSALKAKLKSTWQSGDYGIFAKYLEKGALEFFDRLDIAPGTRLLDVACGAGQLTLPAARRGIDVVGIDLAANLVEQANQRLSTEHLKGEVVEGDAEELPFPTASFDAVMSLIGSMFAPRPELVASEMIRVCRPGGRIIMGNWTPQGHVGQMFKVIGKHIPPSPIFPSPLLWGDESICRERLGNGVSDIQITPRLYPMDYPFAPEKVVDWFIDYYGPTNRGYASLSEPARAAFRQDLIALWERNNKAKDGTTQVRAEYIEVIGYRA